MQKQIADSDIIFDESPSLDSGSKLVKRNVNSINATPYEEDIEDHWLWGHVNRLKRSIHHLLRNEDDENRLLHGEKFEIINTERKNHKRAKHIALHKNQQDKQNRKRRQFHEENEDDNEIEDGDDDNDTGSGYSYDVSTVVYSTKPSKMCKYCEKMQHLNFDFLFSIY